MPSFPGAPPGKSARFMVALAAVLALHSIRCTHDLDLPADPGPGGAISGRAVIQESVTGRLVPATGATVEFLTAGNRTTVGDDGRFSVRPPDGTWQMLLRHGCNTDRSVCQRQRIFSSVELPLLPDTDLSLGDVILNNNGEIRGSIQLSDRQAGFGGVAVFVPGAPFRAETGDDGTFALVNVPEGKLTLSVFLDGYAPESRTGVAVQASDQTNLAGIVLQRTPPSNVTGVIEGVAHRADGAPGQVHISALRGGDSSPAGDLTVGADEAFRLDPLPLGLYTVTIEAEGYGRVIVPNVLVHEAVTLDVKMGIVTVPSSFDGGTGGTGGSLEPGSCGDAFSAHGPCVVGHQPPSDLVLPSMAPITLSVDRPLDASTVEVFLQSEQGAAVTGVTQYIPPAAGIGTGGSGGIGGAGGAGGVGGAGGAGGQGGVAGSGGAVGLGGAGGIGGGTSGGDPTAYSSLIFTPSRPLSPGTWTALLGKGVRDLTGHPPPQVGPTWLVTGIAVGPAVVGTETWQGGTDLHPSLAPGGSFTYLAFDENFSFQSRSVFAGELSTTQVFQPTQIAADAWGTGTLPASRLVDPGDGNDPTLVAFTPCRVGYAPQAGALSLFGQMTFSQTTTFCGDSFAVASRAPLEMAAVPTAGSASTFALLVSDPTGTTFQESDHPEVGTVRAMDLFDVEPPLGPRGPVGQRSRVLAAASSAGTLPYELKLWQAGPDGSLSQLPGTATAPAGGNFSGDLVGCSALGHPVIVYGGFVGDFPVSFAAYHDGSAFQAIPAPYSRGRALACRTVGTTPFLLWSDYSSGALLGAYLILDEASPASSAWVPIRDPSQAGGRLNIASFGACSASSADLVPGLGSNLVFAFGQVCSGDGSFGELGFRQLQ